MKKVFSLMLLLATIVIALRRKNSIWQPCGAFPVNG